MVHPCAARSARSLARSDLNTLRRSERASKYIGTDVGQQTSWFTEIYQYRIYRDKVWFILVLRLGEGGLIYTAHTLRSKAVRLVGLLAIKVRDRMLVWPRLLTPIPSARCVSVLVRIFTVQFSHLFLPLPIPNPPFSLFVVYLCLEVGDLEVEIHLVESAGQTNSSE